MRQVTREEAESWLELAREYGFVGEDGHFALGRFVVEGIVEGSLQIRFITPLPAGLYTEAGIQLKTPPISFDRTGDGRIILPARWWQLMFERLSESEDVPDDVRATAARAARTCLFSDAYLPVETDTIEILAPDSRGEMVLHEALPPRTIGRIKILPA